MTETSMHEHRPSKTYGKHLPKRKNQTGESDYIDNAAVFSALSKVKDGLKCHGKKDSLLVALG